MARRPMLGRLVRELPRGDYLYEPKWDGFRCIAVRQSAEVELWSRHGRPLGRYFPEVVEATLRLDTDRIVIDGELVVTGEGRFDFASLMARLHPAASRVERLRAETPASFIVFDLPELGGRSLAREPFERRRKLLERELPTDGDQLKLTPITDDPAEADGWLRRFSGVGIDGVMAKPRDMPYVPGKRLMLKVKLERTAECVVAGLRDVIGEPQVASLLLGLYDGDELRHVGVISSLRRAQREAMWDELVPLAIALESHPWRNGYLVGGGAMGRLAGAAGRWTPEMGLDWVPLRPERVCEVAFDQVDDCRFRHPARFKRWREDREPTSCRLEQLAQPRSA